MTPESLLVTPRKAPICRVPHLGESVETVVVKPLLIGNKLTLLLVKMPAKLLLSDRVRNRLL